TRRGAFCRQGSWQRGYAGDEGLALRSRPAGGGFKPPHAAAVAAVRGWQCGATRCDAAEGGVAPRRRPAGGGLKPPHAAAVTAVRGERCGNGAGRGVRWGSGRRPLSTCRYLTQGGIKTGEILCDPG